MIKYIITFIFFSITIFGQSNFHEARIKMVNKQIEARGIEEPDVLDAFLNVERHQFVTGSYVSRAYSDSPLPIGYGQTISQPYIVAYMTEVIKPDSNDVVLEIGTGSGYQAAILAEIVKEVYTIEIVAELAQQSKERIFALGYDNVQVKNADGYYGWEEHAPFDAIVVTAAAEYIPPPLIEQLKDGGKMIIPVGSPFLTQRLMLVEKENGETKTTSLLPVRFVPFTRGE